MKGTIPRQSSTTIPIPFPPWLSDEELELLLDWYEEVGFYWLASEDEGFLLEFKALINFVLIYSLPGWYKECLISIKFLWKSYCET